LPAYKPSMKYFISAVFAVAFIFSCKTKTQITTDKDRVKDPHILLDTVTITSETKAPVYRESYPRVNDLLHSRLEVSFDWNKQYCFGKATLTLRPYFYPTDSLKLDAKGFELKEVSLVAKDGQRTPLKHEYVKDQIFIKLDKTYTRDETYRIFIEYIAKPNERISGGSSAITSDKGLYFINPLGKDKTKPMQIWTQGETESNSCWFPTIDKPDERMTQEIFITIEKKFVTLSNGILVSSKETSDGMRVDYWKQNLPAAPYLTMMAIGDYAVIQDKWKRPSNGEEINVNYFVEHEYASYAKAIFGNTPQMISFYSKVLGVEYPWDKYSQVVVRDYVSGAMENVGAVVHGEFMHRTDRELLDRDNEDVIAHELFHHWFGDLVTCESWSNIPLNESFATYGEYMWIEYKYGREYADLHHYESAMGYFSESTRKKEKLIRFDYESREDMFDGHSYNKGGQVLHMLRKLIGDDAFYASLHLYLEQNKFSTVEIHNLRLAVEQVTGLDMNWFFNQWFLSAGHPELTILHAYDETTKKYTVTLKQTQDFSKTALFRLPMTIDIYVNGNVERKQIVMTDAKQDFTFDVPSQPDLVNVDAEKMLLINKTENKATKEWAFQYRNGKLFLDRYEALAQLAKRPSDPDAKDCLLRAVNDKFWYLREYAISKLSNIFEENKVAIKEKLVDLAKSDPQSDVRISALEFLVKNYPGDADLMSLYKYAMTDKSYGVMGVGLSGITKLNPEEGMKLAKGLESEKSTSLLFSIAELYAENGSDANNDFFINSASRFKGFSNIGFVNLYVAFLKRCSDETVLKSLPVFENIAKNESSKWVRYFGQKGVNDLVKFYQDKEDKLNQKISEIRSTNPNPTGIKKLEEDLANIQLTKEKLSMFYNGLIQ
jgi:aminopeptidase N